MQIANNYDKETFNGDIGFITAIDAEEAEVAIDFDGRRVVYVVCGNRGRRRWSKIKELLATGVADGTNDR
jgi:ATP-dependent exoDNAse (exonuclease V) alpha subunit